VAKRPTSGKSGSGRSAAFSAALSSREIPQILSAVLDRVDENRKEEIRLEAKRARVESDMFAVDLKRLTKKYGKDHPRVRLVQTAQASIERQARLADAMVRRIETLKPPVSGGWTATGRVWDENGIPVAQVEVGFAAEATDQSNLEPTKTDDEGEFYATYAPDIVKPLVEKGTTLTLVVRKGRTVLYRDQFPFNLQPNAIRQFRVRFAKLAKK
jgi:hypothetical protein